MSHTTDDTIRLAADELVRPAVAVQIAAALRAARAARDLTQKAAAELVEMPLSTYVSLEGGKHRPSASTMGHIGRLINLKLEEVSPKHSGLVNFKVANS